jgi:hypothetical protein
MVDFGHLSRFEREWVTRLIFVYPWLKGSTKYLGTFVADHPIQTALFAALLYWQQDRLAEAFPEGHPGYLKWYVPISNDGDNPYGFRMEQMFTPLQPLDLAAEIAFWVSGGKFDMPWGSNEEGMVTKLNPLYEEILKTVQGWDSFTQQEVSQGLPDLFRRLVDPRERWASWDRLKKVIDKTTHEGIYDTTQTQNWLRLFLGSLAPINVDDEEAAERAEARKIISTPDPTDAERVEDWAKKVEEVTGSPPPEDVLQLKRDAMLFDATYAEYKRENRIETGLTPQRKLAVLALFMAKKNPNEAALWERRAEEALKLDAERAEEIYREGREKTGLTRYGRIDKRISAGMIDAAEEDS